MKLNEISEQLYYEEIISNKFAFKLWNKINFLERKLNMVSFILKVEIRFTMLPINYLLAKSLQKNYFNRR